MTTIKKLERLAMEIHHKDRDIPGSADEARRSGEYEEPQGDLERQIAQLWNDLFHLENVGRNDNFFELGGNSVLAMDLSEMYATRLGLEVPALAIFQHPTIVAMAQLILESQQ
jgi:aryl carrier-like protein